MKILKKISLFTIACLSLIGLTGCGSDVVSGSLEDLMTRLYQTRKYGRKNRDYFKKWY